jgi:hypothetical protein
MDPSLRYTLKEATTIGDYNRAREGIKMAAQTIVALRGNGGRGHASYASGVLWD